MAANEQNREQRKYQCTAAHEDWSHPTTMVNEYRPNNNNSPTEHGVDKETGSNTHISSPTKSPVIKKTRQGQSSSAFVCTILGNDDSSAGTDSYDGKEEML